MTWIQFFGAMTIATAVIIGRMFYIGSDGEDAKTVIAAFVFIEALAFAIIFGLKLLVG